MAYHAKVEFIFGEEGLYGFGSHEEGYGNLRGKSRQLYQQNMKACVPSFVSTKGYGFLFDCRSLMTFEDNAYGSYVWMDTVDELDYYFSCWPGLPVRVADISGSHRCRADASQMGVRLRTEQGAV